MKAILRIGFLALAIMALAVPADAGPLEDGWAAYSREDYATALKLWRPLAEQGDAEAQTNLGIMYNDGRGEPDDVFEAVTWFREAAEQGYARAQVNLSFMYARGRGVSEDNAEAKKWGDLANAQLLNDGKNLDWRSAGSTRFVGDYYSIVKKEAGSGLDRSVMFFSNFYANAGACESVWFECGGPGNILLTVAGFNNEEAARLMQAGGGDASLSANSQQFRLAANTSRLDRHCSDWDIEFTRQNHLGGIWPALIGASSIEITVGSRRIHIALNAADKANLATVAEACLGRLPP